MGEALRLVPDINVLLSALTSSRGPAVELHALARQFDLIWVLCEGHFDELQKVLSYKEVLRLNEKLLEPAYTFGVAAELHRIGEYHSRLERFDWPSCPDRKDWYLLDLLMTTDADGIVTRDRHLLEAGDRLMLDIFPPAVWRARLRTLFNPSAPEAL